MCHLSLLLARGHFFLIQATCLSCISCSLKSAEICDEVSLLPKIQPCLFSLSFAITVRLMLPASWTRTELEVFLVPDCQSESLAHKSCGMAPPFFGNEVITAWCAIMLPCLGLLLLPAWCFGLSYSLVLFIVWIHARVYLRLLKIYIYLRGSDNGNY